MIGGIYGKILHIDLTNSNIYIEQPNDEFYRLLVGGRAFVGYYLLRELPRGTDPLSPNNLLIFAPGIFQGTNLPGTGRHGVGGKSPLTGGIGSSDVGGYWGNEFKRTGYDALIIHGRAEKPVYLQITEKEVEICSADHLWGLTTAPTQALIREEFGDPNLRIAQIGPAGENLVKYSNVIHDVNRAAGRNGLGAVMGSKNLKAVAVRGKLKLPIVDRNRVNTITKWFKENYKDRMGWAVHGMGRGTQDSLMVWGELGGLPTKNFSEPTFQNRELLSGKRNYEMFVNDRDSCHACPVRCKQVFSNKSDDPRYQLNPEYGGAEYEAMAAFGSCCGIDDNLAVLKANELSNAYGLDVISSGMSIAFVMECFENGILNSKDTNGLEFTWGNANVLAPAIEMIAYRKGFGDVMAEGVARMSDRFGLKTKPFNLTVKNQELPMHEPRLKPGTGIGYAVSPTGADHMVNIADTNYVVNGWWLNRINAVLKKKVKPLPRTDLGEDKLQIFFHEVNLRHFQDCALLCFFYCYEYTHLAEALSGITGEEYDVNDILNVGLRANTLARLFNYREGLSATDDKLPDRVMKAFTKGPLAGFEISEDSLNHALHRFYELMEWDVATGEPTDKCLHKLHLDRLLLNIDYKPS